MHRDAFRVEKAGHHRSPEIVDAALDDYRQAGLPTGLVATLAFLEKVTKSPGDLAADDARQVLRTGVQPDALEDAIAVAAIFAVVTRYADVLAFAIPTADEFDRAGDMLLKRGYGS